MLLLELALKVASNIDQTCGFGPLVTEHGSVVIFSAEDDEAEIHRRLERLDPQCERLKYKDRLFIVPLPNAGGPFAILRNIRGKAPEILPKFEDICKQLNSIKDLKLIVFDPLISFVHADINSDPEMGGYVTGLFANLASETGAAVIAAHHMRKPKGNGSITPELAREAIRGTSALVDGVRCSFALWPASAEHQNFVFSTLKLSKVSNAVYQGAIVKSNGQADRSIKTYLRSQTGLLEDVSEQLSFNKHSSETFLLQSLIVCQRCQYAYYGTNCTSNRNGKKLVYYYYRCTGIDASKFNGNKVCDNKSIRADVLDTAIWEEVKSLLKEPNKIMSEYQRRLSENKKPLLDQTLEKQESRLRLSITKFIDSYSKGFISQEEFEPKIKEMKQRLKNFEEQKEKMLDQKKLQQEVTLLQVA